MQARPRRPESRAGGRFQPPFGGVEQREQQALACAGARHAHLAAFLTLRLRESSNRWVADGIPSLARWGCMSPVTMRRSLDFLIGLGVVAEEPPRPRTGGPQGSWCSPRRALPYSDWPEDLRARVESCQEPSHRHRPPGVESSSPETVAQRTRASIVPQPRLANQSERNPGVLQAYPSDSNRDLEASRILGSAEPQWRAVLERLRPEMSQLNFVTWFRDTGVEVCTNEWVVTAPNAFAAQWIDRKYRGLIRQARSELGLGVGPIRVLVAARGDLEGKREPNSSVDVLGQANTA